MQDQEGRAEGAGRGTKIVWETSGVGVPLGSWGLGPSKKILGVMGIQESTEAGHRGMKP